MKDISNVPESFQNGRYKILKKLGEGGKGIVFKCLDNNLNRVVAIKLIKGDVTEGDSYSRIRREAETTAKMSHQNMVAIYDMQKDGDRFYMVMEFVDGDNLLEYVARSRRGLSVNEVIRITISVAEALEYAHERGVFHRDIKPENIMMTKDGTPKIMDFGLAKAFDSPSLTHAGTIVGTPAYISPESALGKNVDARSDLYSLGCVIYFMCTGVPPFSATDSIQLIYNHIHDYPPPPSSINEGIPKQLDSVVMKLLRKNPSERFQDAHKLVEAIRGIEDLINVPERVMKSEGSFDNISPKKGSISSSQIRTSSLIGVDPEVSLLKGAVDSVLMGEGKAVMVIGDSGQGKTRLCEELIDYGLLRGLKVIMVRGKENRSSTPNYILSDVFREFFFEAPQQLIYKVCGNYGDVAAKVLPDLSGKLGRISDLSAQDPNEAALRFQEGIFEIMKNMGKEMPVLLVLDDLNYADYASLGTISSLLENVKNINMLLLMTSIPADDLENPILEKIVGSRRITSIRLHNLDKEQTAELIARQLGEEKRNITDEFTNFIFSRTKGNPLYVEEVLKLLIEKKMIFRKDSGSWDRKPIDEIGIPSSVKGIIRERLSNIGERSKEILSVSSVIGQEFDIDVLEKLMDSIDSNTLYNEIEKLEKSRILMERKTRPGQFKLYFGNPQVYSYFFDSVSMLRKKKLHGKIAQVMLSLYGEDDQDALPELAYHFLEAGDYENAMKFGKRLADMWASSFQFERAAKQYRSTLEIIEMLPGYTKNEEGRKQKAILLYNAAFNSSYAEESDYESIEQAIRIFEGIKDNEMVARCLILIVSRKDDKQKYWLNYAVNFLRKNMEAPELRSVVTRLGWGIASAFWYKSEFKEAREINDETLEYAANSGIEDLFSQALRLTSSILLEIRSNEDIETIFTTYREAEDYIVKFTSENPEDAFLTSVAVSFYDSDANKYFFLKHDLGLVERSFNKGLKYNLDLCSKSAKRVIIAERALLVLLPEGKWDELKAVLDEEQLKGILDTHVGLVLLLINSIIDAYRGKWDSAMHGFDKIDGASSTQFITFSSPFKAMTLIEMNKLEEAIIYVANTLNRIKSKILNGEVFRGYVEMSYCGSVAGSLSGDKENSEKYLDILIDFSKRFDEEWISAYKKAAESFHEEAFGEIKNAIELMKDARDYFISAGYELFGAQLSYELARLHHKNNDWEKSNEALTRAYDTFDRLSCSPYVEKCLRLKELLKA